jgi:hypothetical protein
MEQKQVATPSAEYRGVFSALGRTHVLRLLAKPKPQNEILLLSKSL